MADLGIASEIERLKDEVPATLDLSDELSKSRDNRAVIPFGLAVCLRLVCRSR